MSNDMESRMQDQIEGAQRDEEQRHRISEAMKALVPDGGWAGKHESISIGGTKVESLATRMCYALGQILECNAPGEFASALSQSAWDLLTQIGRYEDGFELGEDGGGQP